MLTQWFWVFPKQSRHGTRKRTPMPLSGNFELDIYATLWRPQSCTIDSCRCSTHMRIPAPFPTNICGCSLHGKQLRNTLPPGLHLIHPPGEILRHSKETSQWHQRLMQVFTTKLILAAFTQHYIIIDVDVSGCDFFAHH